MLLHELKSDFQTQLADQFPKEEITSFFNRLCEFKLDLKRVDIALNLNKNIDSNDVLFFKDAINRLKLFEPIQYIIGSTEFYGLPFRVDKNVLIPRPETEELVSWILEKVGSWKSKVRNSKKEDKNLQTTNLKLQTSNQPTLNILDIGTGSGCIAIALAKNLPNAKVWALDVSEKALNIAKQNADFNKVKINFIEADILKPNEILHYVQNDNIVIASETQQSQTDKEITRPNVPLRYGQASVASLPRKDIKFDIIVSNPPYVKQNEKALMQANVLKHEPHLALFVENNNPLLFYNKIAHFAHKNLSKNGMLFFEINQSLGKEVLALLKTKDFKNSILKKDMFDVDRMVQAVNN
ncbi:MAG: peptide chain release factor N(5)-glutamine methyltransferase [Flavobacteriaceae bacterium]